MAHIVFATCLQWPEISENDGYVACALRGLGHHVIGVPWNGDFSPFTQADMILLRSNWDYHHDIPGFHAWLDRIEADRIPIYNTPQMVRWNLHKGYLTELASWGIETPVSEVYRAGHALDELYERHGFSEAVIKPVYGASGHLVERVGRHEISAWQSRDAHQRDAWLVQAFLPEIQSRGELSFVFLDGHYSHTIEKRPRQGEFRVNSQYEGQLQTIDPDNDILQQARQVILALPEAPLYARVDGVVRDDRSFCVCELELNEPSLYFSYAPEQANTFAEVIDRRIAKHA